jgi:zinc and cadmium transporter
MLINIIITTSIISLFSLIGIFTLALKEKLLKKIILFLVSMSAGVLLGGALFHLIPEALEGLEPMTAMICVLGGFVLFFLVEKLLHWRHCHNGVCKIHTFGYVNLIGDAIHNFIDGLIIAASYLSNMGLGIITSFAIGLHEVPQEIGDFGVLLHSGIKKKKALWYNFLTAITIIIGGIVGYFLSGIIGELTIYLLPFAAGGFLYISSSDLVPEIHKENNMTKWLLSFTTFLIGTIIMYSLTFLE